MSKKNGKLKKAQKKKLLKMFFKMMAITFGVCLLIGGALVGCYQYFIHDSGSGTTSVDGKPGKKPGKKDDINKNLAVFGVDKDGYRTDVIFVVNFNSKTGKAKVVSLPRDTKVEWTESQKQKLRDYDKYVVSVSKLNEMTAYGGIEHIRDFTINHIENMLGIRIDNYVLVSIDAFKEIVDAIGGVEVDVPQRMYYTDRAQGLYIDLQPGVQQLNGEQAEMLVRYRKGADGSGYAEGDVGRIKTQQRFLEAFAQKVLSPQIIKDIPKIVPIIFKSIQTDVALGEIPGYYSYLNGFDMTNLTFHIVPGEAAYQSGAWYFVPDMNQMDTFAQEVFYDVTPAGESAAPIVEDKTVSIEVLNGTGVAGAAATAKDTLVAAGYTVGNIGNYTQIDVPQTIIYAKDTAKGEQFKAYFPNSKVESNTTIPTDIQIVLGLEQQ